MIAEDAAPLTTADVRDDLRALVDHYFAHGCPCRFPRLRAYAWRDVEAECGAFGWISDEQVELASMCAERLGLLGTGAHGRPCATCGAACRYVLEDAYRGQSWVPYLHVEPVAGAVDLGAPLDVVMPRLLPFRGTCPTPTALDRAIAAFPRVSREDWFAWMKALG